MKKKVNQDPLSTMTVVIKFDPKVIEPASLQERLDLAMAELKTISARGVLAIQGYTVSTSPDSFVYRESPTGDEAVEDPSQRVARAERPGDEAIPVTMPLDPVAEGQ